MSNNNRDRTVSTFYIRGLHCAACELIIEKRLNKIEGIIKADVSLQKETLDVETETDQRISTDFLNGFFAGDGYTFSEKPFEKQNKNINISCESEEVPNGEADKFMPFMIAALILMVFYILQKTGFTSLVSVNSQSALPAFFLFGLLAGVSSCAALVGGIVLSMSKQWMSQYNEGDSFEKKAEPHILFNIGRVAGYALFGAVLGYIGNFFRLSPSFSAMLVIGVSAVMILLGLQMLGVKVAHKFQLRLPKSFTNKVSDEQNFKGRTAPFFMGALTFFLPCGFTVTAQALALASGVPLQGALIMGLFALGTVPGLMAIGLGSVQMFGDKNKSKQFSTVAGLLVLAFSAFNINAQMTVLGLTNIGDIVSAMSTSQVLGATDLVPSVGGKQVIKMTASSNGYTPNKFRVKVGQIDLTQGETAIKEFTPTKVGIYKFSCWMGMISGTIEVVDAQGLVGSNTTPVATGAKGCGCGGGGTGSCGAK